MKRADDFAERRKHIANLTDQELYDRFWALTEQVVAPLLELGRRNTTPSVERAVLLRMGIALRTISAACAWPPGTAPTTSWSSGIWASPTSTA